MLNIISSVKSYFYPEKTTEEVIEKPKSIQFCKFLILTKNIYDMIIYYRFFENGTIYKKLSPFCTLYSKGFPEDCFVGTIVEMIREKSYTLFENLNESQEDEINLVMDQIGRYDIKQSKIERKMKKLFLRFEGKYPSIKIYVVLKFKSILTSFLELIEDNTEVYTTINAILIDLNNL